MYFALNLRNRVNIEAEWFSKGPLTLFTLVRFCSSADACEEGMSYKCSEYMYQPHLNIHNSSTFTIAPCNVSFAPIKSQQKLQVSNHDAKVTTSIDYSILTFQLKSTKF